MTLRVWGGAVLLAAVSAALISGCGSAPAEDKNAKQSLITLQDLPTGATVKEEFPEPCAPEPILEEDKKAKVAASQPFGVKEAELKEAIGMFPGTEKAGDAYDELTSNRRSECIASAMKGFNPPEDTVEPGPVTSLDLADEDWTRQYLLLDPSSKVQGSLDAVTMRSGVCVATLIFLTEGGKTEDGLVQEVAETAADLLPDSCG